MIYVIDIIEKCNGILYSGDTTLPCTSFSKDTRTIKENDVYVGIKGENFNGSDYYQDAINKGSKILILDKNTNIKDVGEDITIILVNDTIKAIQELARYKRTLYDIPVIGITGSVGKTSVKDIVSHVLKSKYKVLSTIGNHNNHIGLPLTILSLTDEEVLVLEMGMNHAGEMHLLSSIANPTICIITNIGTAHIGNLGSRENILKAKLEILDSSNQKTLIINNDNDLLHEVNYPNLIKIGIDNESDYMATDINQEAFSSNFKINNTDITIPNGSRAFIYNALFAYATATLLGLSPDEIKSSLVNFVLTSHRLELIKTSKYQIIDDTYNASYDSVKNALELLSKVKERKVFIFADILELDEYAKEIHESIAKLIIDNNIDLLITIGINSKYTSDLVEGSYHFNTNNDAISKLNDILKPNDVILVKGSNGMKLIDIVNYLKKD